MKTLEDQVAIITGAGSGIGKAIAELFASEGAKLIISDINKDNVETVAAAINAMAGNVATALVVDVSREDDVHSLIARAIKLHGTLDILVNNAGIMDQFTPVGEVSNQLWEKVMGVNVNGPFYACREAVNIMAEKGKGAIVNIASIGGLFGGRAGAAYTASKHAVIGLTKNIGYTYAVKGIRCNAIAPGGVATNIAQGEEPSSFGLGRMSLGIGNNIRMAESSEIAEIALFLASDKASFINGTVITGDGGWTAY